MAEIKRLTKTVKFKESDPEEISLHEWLKRLPHGKFSEDTKVYWMERMKEDDGK